MMQGAITEGGGDKGHVCRLNGHALANRPAVYVLVAMGCMAFSATGQTRAAGGFDVTIVDVSADSQRVTVAQNRSIIVQTSVEFGRADVVASHIADVQVISPKQLLVTGKSYGRTNVILWDKEEHQYVLDVGVELDLSDLNKAMAAIDPQSDARAVSMLGNIVLSGAVSGVERARRMAELAELFLPRLTSGAPATSVQNHLDVAGEQQVLLKCVVAEVARSAMRELGINGFLAGDNFKDVFLVSQIAGINPINIGAAADALVNQRIPFLTGTDGIPLLDRSSLSLGFPRVQMQLFVRALADNTLASILAEPNLVAISGETATFLAGGEFPIPVPQGNQQVTIEFREFGIRLNFTPIVKAHQRIRLRIAPEISELDFTAAVRIEGFVVPGLTSRAMETTVEVGSGETIAIAGLLSEQVRGLASSVPGIGDVPVIGALFRSVNFKRSLTELVVMVTPEIVAPLDAHQRLKLPTEGRQDPDDFELYMLGLLEGGKRADAGDQLNAGEARVSGALVQSQPEELLIHGPWGRAVVPDTRYP